MCQIFSHHEKSSLYRIIFLALSILFLVGCNEIITPLLPVTDTFDSDAQGWQVNEGGKGGFSPVDGNLGGFVYGVDNAPGFWYFVAPAGFIASIRKAYGLQLIFDLEQSATDSQAESDDVILTDGVLTLTYKTAYHPKTTWTPYSVKLDEAAGWKKGKVKATKAELQQVLQNLTSLKIRGEYRAGPDRGGLDNVSIH